MFAKDLEPGMMIDNEYLFLGFQELENDARMLRLIELNDPYWGELVRSFDDEDDFEIKQLTDSNYEDIVLTLLDRTLYTVKLAAEVQNLWISETKC